jgi:hypothetical protein
MILRVGLRRYSIAAARGEETNGARFANCCRKFALLCFAYL